MLNIVPCAMQYDLIAYLFYYNNLHPANSKPLFHRFPNTLPFYNKSDQVILLSQYSTVASHFSQSRQSLYRGL